MLKHQDVWEAIDELAALYGFSPSGLAREAGLDATTFNLSKRTGDGGKKRWPSTESVAKILEVTGASFMEFAALAAKTEFKNKLPTIPFSTASKGGQFDADGNPSGKAWGKLNIAGVNDPAAFGIEINVKSLDPSFRQGAVLVASPASKVQKSDRVVIVTADGQLHVKEVQKTAGKQLELQGLHNKGGKLNINGNELRLLAKIIMVLEP